MQEPGTQRATPCLCFLMFHLWQIDPSSSILNDPLERAFASVVTNEFRWTGSHTFCENVRSSAAKGDTHLRVVDSIAPDPASGV